MKNIFILLGLVLLTAGGGVAYFVSKQNTLPSKQVACTEEAKICPDGSAVARSGPLCEFAACPLAPIATTTPVVVPPVIVPTSSTTVGLNQQIMLNGIRITPLAVIEDSRCPTDVQCIQAGTVKVSIMLESGSIKQPANTTLGSSVSFMNKNVKLTAVTPSRSSKQTLTTSMYRFTFQVTESSVSDKGTLKGTIKVGPICPVEMADNPCDPPPEMYAAYTILIYSSDKKKLIVTLTPDGRGGFSTVLPVGTYVVDIGNNPTGSVGSKSGVPKIVTITKGVTTTISIDIDTGIR